VKAPERAIREVLEHDVKMVGKQIRMLAELTQGSPVVRRRTDLAECEAEFVVLPRQRVQELVDQMELELGSIRCLLEELAAPGTHGWAKWQIVGDDERVG